MNLKEQVINRLAEYIVKRGVVTDRVSPKYSDVGKLAQDGVETAFNATSIPEVGYMAPAMHKGYKEELDKISVLSSVISDASIQILRDHIASIKAYDSLYNRAKESITFFQRQLDRILSYNCYYINTNFSNHTDNSTAGRIGSFITLPYYLNNAKMYRGGARMYATSTSEVSFSNLEVISSIPFETNPSLKIASKDKEADVTITTSIEETPANAIYIGFENQLKYAKITLSLDGTEVYSYEGSGSEFLLNFMPLSFNSISVLLNVSNPNTDKPLSIQLSKIDIYTNIQFTKTGTFESKPEQLTSFSNVSSIELVHQQVNVQTDVEADQLISIGSSDASYGYSRIDKGVPSDISLYRFRYGASFDSSSDTTEKTIDGKEFTVLTIPSSEQMSSIDFKSASVYYGLNNNFIAPTVDIEKRYENWTRSGNYYITSILNLEDEVYVNIGKTKCVINGREKTGNFRMPSGVSTIEVHTKDIDLTADPTDRSNTTATGNLAYMFTGLPVYDEVGQILNPVTEIFSVNGQTAITLRYPLMPFTEIVQDSIGNVYKLSLTKGPHVPGTYCVEPNAGKIRVYPVAEKTTLTVTYTRASNNNRPCGVLFNRLLTFASLNSTLSAPEEQGMHFTFQGTSDQKYLLLPKMTNPFSSSHVVYNGTDDNLFVSAKIDMRTTNKYLTPVINQVYFSVK